MKILLDTHMLGQKETGNERYWKNLSSSLSGLKKDIVLNYIPEFKNGLYRIFFGFNRAIRAIKADIIHVQNFTPFIKTVPIVNTVHDLCFKPYPNLFGFKTNLAFFYFFRRSLDLSDVIICVSKSTKQSLLKFYNIDSKKVFVVYEAADKCFRYIKNKKEVKKELAKKFNFRGKYFLVVGNIERRKLPYVIIDSLNKIIKKYPDVKIVFAGPNKLNLKETKNVKILGYVPDEELNLLYNGSVSLIYLSLCEGFGLPMIEAMATKTPIICSNLAVFKEVAGSSAFFVKDKRSLSKAMLTFLKNKSLRKKYSDLGYRMSKFFSWEKTAKDTLKIYERVLATKKSSISK